VGAAAHLVAVDLGASSGRVFLGAYAGDRLEISQVHRFSHAARVVDNRLRWDAAQIFAEILIGLQRAALVADGAIEAISVDGWGVDYGLLDRDGVLLADPVHYRDTRTAGTLERVHRTMSDQQLFTRTGVASWSINTLYQLLSEPQQLDGAAKLLFIPDLFQHWLSGSGASEATIASTSQMLSATDLDWDAEVLAAFGLGSDLLPPLIAAGTDLGPLVPWVRDEVGLPGAHVVMPAAHDSAAAALGVPRPPGTGAAWVSSGTWSIVGVDVAAPVISADARAAQLSNEPAPGGVASLTRNVMGMWLLQECRRHWFGQGQGSERELVELAAAEADDVPLIDPDDPRLSPPGDMPGRIRDLASAGGFGLESRAAVVRCVLESVAAKTCWSLERCADAAGLTFDVVHVVGGGSQIELLNRLCADFSGRPVVVGPTEAAVLGSASVQLLALGRLSSWGQLRELVHASAATAVFEPSAQSVPRRERLAAASQAWAATTASTTTDKEN